MSKSEFTVTVSTVLRPALGFGSAVMFSARRHDQHRAGGELHTLAAHRSEQQAGEASESARAHHEHEGRNRELGKQLRRLRKGGAIMKGDTGMPWT